MTGIAHKPGHQAHKIHSIGDRRNSSQLNVSMSAALPCDGNWPSHFEQIKYYVLSSIAELNSGIEHLGSTSVPELAAKPIIDVDVVYNRDSYLPEIIRRLETLGYRHIGDKGIEGREAFSARVDKAAFISLQSRMLGAAKSSSFTKSPAQVCLGSGVYRSALSQGHELR